MDESKRQSKYFICAATVTAADCNDMRKQVRALRPKGSEIIHMSKIGDQDRSRVLSGVARLDVESRLYVARMGSTPEREVRDALLDLAAAELDTMGVRNLKIESCGQDREDGKVLTRKDLNLRYSFASSKDDPLLWLPDVYAWAWGRSRSMRRKVEHRISVTQIEI